MTDRLASYAAAKERIPALGATEHVYVRAAARLNNLIERSHQATRVRERRMRRFKAPTSDQRFLSTFSRIWNHFQLRRHPQPARQHRELWRARLHIWRELTGMAAPVN